MSMLDPRAAAVRGALNGLPQGPGTLADIFGGGAEPVTVSPASPAPMRPGIEIKAPPTMGGRPILSARTPPPAAAQAPAEAAVGDAAAANAARSAEDQFGRLYGQMRAKSQEALRAAEADARVDPDQEAMFDQRQRRIETDRGDVEKEKRQSDWDALANLGFTMARSNSPFFATALAEGLTAGTRGFSASRAQRARDRALLADREDAIAQARYAALKGAQQEARQKVIEGATLAKADIEILSKTEETIERMATSKAAIEKAKAEASKATTEATYAEDIVRADIGYKEAAAAAARAAAAENYAGAEAYRSGQRGGGRGLDGDRYDREEIDKASDQYREAVVEANKARRDWQAPVGRGDTRSKIERYNAVITAQEKALLAANAMRRAKGQAPISLRQLFPGGGAAQRAVSAAAPAAPAGGGAPTMEYVPGKGLVSVGGN